MANKIENEDVYQIGVNELDTKASLETTDVTIVQESSSGSVKKTALSALIAFFRTHLSIPSKTSDLTNDSDYQTGAEVTAEIAASHQSIKTLNTDNSTAQSVNASEAIAGSGTVNLHKVAKTGSYNDLLNQPSIPSAANDGTLTIQKNGATAGTFSADQSGNTTVNITVPTTASDVNALPDSTVIPTVNNPAITITQGGVTKGSFNLNQASALTIALDAGGGIILQIVDTICYGTPNGSVTISVSECFDLINGYFIKLSGGNWIEDTSISVVDGMIIYAIEDDAYYIYNSNYGLLPLTKGKSVLITSSADTNYYIDVLMPIADSFGEIELTSSNMAGSTCYLNITGMFSSTDYEFYSKSIGKVHTICLKNSKSSDIDITVTDLYYGSLQGFISSGLDSSNTFTLKTGEHAEISVIFKDSGNTIDQDRGNYALACFIVKNDFVNNLTQPV